MKKTIYKYNIPIKDYFNIIMPIGSEILCVQAQNDEPQIWALVNIELKETEERYFKQVGTGHLILDENLKYIGTFQLIERLFVGHIFEIL